MLLHVFNTALFLVWYTTLSRALVDIFYSAVFPTIMARDKLWYRILTALAGSAGLIASEMFISMLFYYLGYDMVQNFRDVQSHMLDYYMVQGIIGILFAIALYPLHLLLKRITHNKVEPVVLYFGGCLFGQVVLTCTLLGVALRVAYNDRTLMAICLVFAVTCLVIDALVLGFASRANAAYERSRQAEALRAQLDACMAHFKAVADESQAVARFRHDLRDQLQTVAALVRAGDYARAEAIVGDLETYIS